MDDIKKTKDKKDIGKRPPLGKPSKPPITREYIPLADRDGAVGTIMLAPAIIYVAGLVAIPFFLAVALSLSDATVGNPSIH
ncbi:MAG TPA: hypothetical protein VFX37_14320, partial [Pseudolabrys sp.]|nr:hypothetical protein [Pseudolabrys sp.]